MGRRPADAASKAARRAEKRERGIEAQLAALQEQLDGGRAGGGGGGGDAAGGGEDGSDARETAKAEAAAKRRRLDKFKQQKEGGGVQGAVASALGVDAEAARRLAAPPPPALRMQPAAAMKRVATLLRGARCAALVLDDAAATRVLTEVLEGTLDALIRGAPDAEYSSYAQTLEALRAAAHGARSHAEAMAGDGSAAAAAARVETVMALDVAYYDLYYHSTAADGALRRFAEAAGEELVDAPAAHFCAMERRLYAEGGAELRAALRGFFKQEAGAARFAHWGFDAVALEAAQTGAGERQRESARRGAARSAARASPQAARVRARSRADCVASDAGASVRGELERPPWSAPSNALLDVQRAKLSETVALFFASGLGRGGEMDKTADVLDTLLRDGKGGKVQGKGKRGARRKAREAASRRAFPLLERWRDSCRDWPARLYAFATPTAAALNALADFGSKRLVADVGAGTGYWAALLRKAGVEVDATDCAPPDRANKHAGAGAHVSGRNEYHGASRCHAKVLPVAAEEAGKRAGEAGATLLLCYAPPDSDMGEVALASYVAAGGQHLAHVGEACGLTGTPALAAKLREGFVLERTVQLPQWGNTANALTLWRRRREGGADEGKPSWLLSCATCRAAGVPLWRCRYTRTVCFCSAECASDAAARGAHRRALAERGVFFARRKPRFGSAADFEKVQE